MNQETAPKAQTISAWGNAPGRVAYFGTQGLKARSRNVSIPQVPLIAFHTIFLEERTEFILKRHFSMVCLLPVDVSNQRLPVSRTRRERSIAALPGKPREAGRLGLEPFRRGRFELFHQSRNVRRTFQSNREMDVISNASNAITFAFGVTNDGGEIRIERGTHRHIENGHAVLRAENHMNQTIDTWGVAPCWYKSAPSALSPHAERPSCSIPL